MKAYAPAPELIVRRRAGAEDDALRALDALAGRHDLAIAEVAPVPRTRRMDPAQPVGRQLRALTDFCRLRARGSAFTHAPSETADALRELDAVAEAYVKAPAALPVLADGERSPITPAPGGERDSYRARQGYLDPAPGGIGIEAAWERGGFGEGVRIVDVEMAWRFSHEDLVRSGAEAVAGREPQDVRLRNHGTNVAGLLVADHNTVGISGIAPAAELFGISIGDDEWATSHAIYRATRMMRPGDVLLLELERFPGDPPDDSSKGFVPIEFWPDDFDAIRYAVERGVIVVEPAGNGSELLDTYTNADAAHFPPGWAPLAGGEQDSGAILVGAGGPHGGKDDLAPLWFTNHGRRVDAQAWGAWVTTTGGAGDSPGDLLGGTGDEDRWYTRSFNGTSSAAPIVAGALACVQSVLRAAGSRPLTPGEARQALRETGTAQRPGGRIGNRPDVAALLAWAQDRPAQAPQAAPATRPGRRPGGGMNVRITIDVTEGDDGLELSTHQVRGPEVDVPQVRGPQVRGPQVRGPQVRGPQVRGPQVRGPEAGPYVAGGELVVALDAATISIPLDAVRAALDEADQEAVDEQLPPGASD